jgi:hypothetical protein
VAGHLSHMEYKKTSYRYLSGKVKGFPGRLGDRWVENVKICLMGRDAVD